MIGPRHYDYYRERSEHFLERFDGELEQSEYELACELLWGAAAHAIKSAAQKRGWEHGSHDLLRTTINRLADENAMPHLLGQYNMMSAFHVGFYGDRQFRIEHMRLAKALVSGFAQTLESLPPDQPTS
ncbi:MAG: HEPN domain-containing protein [Chloroflexi bacterium]|nr:HEPN domain-containing protein [Chloroflexota bacterium]